jgi:hypothetical protein
LKYNWKEPGPRNDAIGPRDLLKGKVRVGVEIQALTTEISGRGFEPLTYVYETYVLTLILSRLFDQRRLEEYHQESMMDDCREPKLIRIPLNLAKFLIVGWAKRKHWGIIPHCFPSGNSYVSLFNVGKGQHKKQRLFLKKEIGCITCSESWLTYARV